VVVEVQDREGRLGPAIRAAGRPNTSCVKSMNEVRSVALTDWRSYSQDLRKCGYTRDAGFLCPVCREAYSGSSKPYSVSHGHIIPAAFGGSSTVLVCGQCEGYMGHSIEAPLINLIKDSRVLHGKADGIVRGKLRMKTDAGPIRVQVSFKKCSGWSIRLPRLGDGEKAFPDAKPGAVLDPPRLEFALELCRDKIDESLQLTVLKAAYLAAFKWLGYAYVLKRDLAWVGRMLRGQPVRRPYTFTVAPPGGTYTLTMVGFPELVSRASHVALVLGTAADLPVLFGFVQLQHLQHLAILPPPDSSVTLEQLRGKLSTGDGRAVSVTLDVRQALAVL